MQDNKLGDEYLEKIIQVYYDIPKTNSKNIFDLVDMYFKEINIDEIDLKEIEKILYNDKLIEEFFGKTPRKIKSLFNKFVVKYNEIKGGDRDIDIRKIFIFSLIEIFYIQRNYLNDIYYDKDLLALYKNKINIEHEDVGKYNSINISDYEILNPALQKLYYDDEMDVSGNIPLKSGVSDDQRLEVFKCLNPGIATDNQEELQIGKLFRDYNIKISDIKKYIGNYSQIDDLLNNIKDGQDVVKDILGLNKNERDKFNKQFILEYNNGENKNMEDFIELLKTVEDEQIKKNFKPILKLK